MTDLASMVRNRLRDGRACVGAWQTVASVKTAEAMSSCGFHWLAVDLEHSTMSLEQAEACFIAAERHGVAPMARLSNADPYVARRLLDAGAAGLLVPVVESADAFTAFAEHCSYRGKRGVGLSRCNNYGDSFETYYRDFQPVLIPQIETRKGVAAAAELAALDFVDGLFFGPYDLSCELGSPGDITTADFADAVAQVRAACQSNSKALGIHQVEPDAAQLRAKIDEGFHFIAYCTDLIAMRTALGAPTEIVESS